MIGLLDEFYDKSFRIISDEYSDDLVKAKKDFFAKTGEVQDEYSDFYEAKMNCFNEWFLLNYKTRWDDKEKFLNKVVKKHSSLNLDENQFQSLLNARYSLFEYIKVNFRGKIIIKDWFQNKKIALADDHPPLSVLEGEIFTGRMIDYQGKSYLLKGVCLLPAEVKNLIKKQVNLVKKGKIDCTEEELLLKLENLKTQSLKYPHVSPDKIFKFE
ncbi:MAG: hypothetical protein H6621_12870 [Halobacteriovoraceae bacterium]|nr:hypothetical protein [Halobacteriovoraceae bacterium]MCB9095954.1 hypothetical protein [Halobacteriovoraceae bacterium]